jgi:hypothetical protein
MCFSYGDSLWEVGTGVLDQLTKSIKIAMLFRNMHMGGGTGLFGWEKAYP